MKYSIIIPVYNAEKYVLKALESLKNQTYQDIEIVVVNDGSTDKSEEVILDFIKFNPKLNVKYQLNKNAGPSTARNAGIQLSTSEYICFLDADDRFECHLFEDATKLLEKDPTADAIYYGFDDLDENDNIINHYLDVFSYMDELNGIEVVQNKYLKKIWPMTCNIIYRRDIIVNNDVTYPEGVYLGEDACFIYKAFMNCKRVRALPKSYYLKTYIPTSLWNNKFSGKCITEFKAIRNTLAYIEEHHIEGVFDYINSLYYHTRVTVAKKMIKASKWYQVFKFMKMNRKYIPKLKKPKVLIFSRKQKVETGIYNFSKFLFFYFVKFFFVFHEEHI